ncbi:MAG TPA: MFS transporter, partial [Candidatus Binatia bacterium]|nr:MFS transporter [Candidatus Binatia bacterium]
MPNQTTKPAWLYLSIAAAAVLMVTMGVRQTQGLFLFPIAGSTGASIASISFAMAVGQFVWGAVQPVSGALADRFGAARVLAAGILLLAFGAAVTPLLTSSFGLVLTFGILTAAGSGAGSFAVLIGSLARRLAPEERGTAAGLISAGGSLGQFVFA